MTVHLPEDLERYVQTEVQNGRFASPDEAITEAVLLLRQKEHAAQSQRKAFSSDELNRQLLEAGLLSQIPARPDPMTYREFSPIVIEGEPLSETIIRERGITLVSADQELNTAAATEGLPVEGPQPLSLIPRITDGLIDACRAAVVAGSPIEEIGDLPDTLRRRRHEAGRRGRSGDT